jgi:hypothetical protein
LDPEYFITANERCLYFQRIIAATSTYRAKNEGEIYIDVQLGPRMGRATTAQ